MVCLLGPVPLAVHQRNLRELFYAFDDDGNGVLSFGEFSSLICACVDRNLDQRHIATLFDEVRVGVARHSMPLCHLNPTIRDR